MAGLLLRVPTQRQGGHSRVAKLEQKSESSSQRRALSPVDMRRVAAALDPEVMQTVPESSDLFIKGLKNPCWERKGTMYCLPYVVSVSSIFF